MRKTMMIAVLSAAVGALVAVPVAVYASHVFNDVPNSNTFHEDIAWLADAGVTLGCNPPSNTEFCPKDEVTREQMAAFMRRLAQNRVVDAGELNGLPASSLAPRAAFDCTAQGCSGDQGDQVVIIAPAPGVLLMSGAVHAFNTIVSDQIECLFTIEGEEVPGTYMYESFEAGDEVECTTTGAAVVDAGTYEVNFVISGENTEHPTSTNQSSMWALWIPFDGSGEVPTP